ncbi:hypothetical protein IB283_10045 [Escherichia coli]|uniref:hypothetical protein n=1 Tax=Escherichia coli TaxID=562 RepID=UPI0016624F51|nr:hypothetical protein [Escherichia coli]QNR78295.1 hypothetical protein IB283_10045 [Escherichia coli]
MRDVVPDDVVDASAVCGPRMFGRRGQIALRDFRRCCWRFLPAGSACRWLLLQNVVISRTPCTRFIGKPATSVS